VAFSMVPKSLFEFVIVPAVATALGPSGALGALQYSLGSLRCKSAGCKVHRQAKALPTVWFTAE
jgi:hypothetical protein